MSTVYFIGDAPRVAEDTQEIRGLAGFVTGFSKYIEQEAQKYDLPYLEVSNDSFKASIDSAVKFY